MNRKNFIKLIGLAAGTLLIPYSLKNPFRETSFELDVFSIEKAIMIKSITGEAPVKLLQTYRDFINDSNLITEIKPIKKELVDLTLEKVKGFSKKRVSYRKSESAKKELDKINYRIELIKQSYSIKNIDNDLQDNLLAAQSYLNKIKYLKRNFDHKIFYDLYFTLERISPDILFIKKASQEADIPLEDIIALITIESNGREFVVSNYGAINRFQINPMQLKYIYNNTADLGNTLSEYIKENTSRKRFLVDLVQDSKLNIATGVNYFAYLRENTKAEWENVVGYCYGPNGISRLSSRIKDALDRLNNGEKLKKKVRHHAVSYYNKFLTARKIFREIKNSVN